MVKGTGMGLAISKALIEAHGGEIGVCSEEGQGSNFFFTLPEFHTGGVVVDMNGEELPLGEVSESLPRN